MILERLFFDLVDIEDGPGLRSAAKLLTKDEAGRIRGEHRGRFLPNTRGRLGEAASSFTG
jgi:hypothetical protein